MQPNKIDNNALNLEIQKIADKVKADVEKELNQVFKKFNVVEHHSIENKDRDHPDRASYSMKVRTDDNDHSHLRLQTTRKDPLAEWKTSVDEFFRGVSPFESMLSTFDPFRTGFSSIQSLADSIKNDVEREINRTFDTFDVMEHYPILTDPEHTSYYMRVKTDDNGHVRVKTIKKDPSSDWQTHVEEYHRGKPALEGQGRKKTEALGNSASKSATSERQSLRNEQIKDKPLEGTPKSSSLRSTTASHATHA